MNKPAQKEQEKIWRDKLSPEQYHITREAGTEAPFSGPHGDEKRDGVYNCVCCGATLFSSETKYDSGTGWPSFYAPRSAEAIAARADNSLMMSRTEVNCAKCDAHLGHVFPDGPAPSGLRYCMNGHALDFIPDKD